MSRSDSYLVIILVVALFGGFSGRFRGYGYGYGHGGVGVPRIILIILVVLASHGTTLGDASPQPTPSGAYCGRSLGGSWISHGECEEFELAHRGGRNSRSQPATPVERSRDRPT